MRTMRTCHERAAAIPIKKAPPNSRFAFCGRRTCADVERIGKGCCAFLKKSNRIALSFQRAEFVDLIRQGDSDRTHCEIDACARTLKSQGSAAEFFVLQCFAGSIAHH